MCWCSLTELLCKNDTSKLLIWFSYSFKDYLGTRLAVRKPTGLNWAKLVSHLHWAGPPSFFVAQIQQGAENIPQISVHTDVRASQSCELH